MPFLEIMAKELVGALAVESPFYPCLNEIPRQLCAGGNSLCFPLLYPSEEYLIYVPHDADLRYEFSLTRATLMTEISVFGILGRELALPLCL